MLAAPPDAHAVFGDRLALAERFAAQLATAGVERGLLGPREVPRLWERHLVNCAVVAELLPVGARVVNVGSGAGLPGLALACCRPDLSVTLLEPLARRVAFLTETVELVGLGAQVQVRRGRAEEPAVRAEVGRAAWVTARAVAPLDRLMRWCLPLLRPGGTLLAIKGDRAAAEIAEHAQAIRKANATAELVTCGVGTASEPTTVVAVRLNGRAGPQRRAR